MLVSPHPAELYAFEATASGNPTVRRASNHVLAACGTATTIIASSAVLKTLFAGGAAGAVSRTMTAPLDRVKMLAQEGRVTSRCPRAYCHPTMLHSVTATMPQKANIRDIVRYVYRNGGVLAFWRGNGVNCLKAGPEQAAAFTARQFYVTRICQDPLNPTFAENCGVGALAGVSAQVLLYPMEVIKTRMAVAECHEYSGIADCFRQSVQRNGFRDLYVGLMANTAGIIPHRGLEMGTFFTLDRMATRAYGEHAPPFLVTMTISFVASMVSQVVTYPLNLARTKLQTQGVNGRPILYSGLVDCLAKVVRQDGIRGLFTGILPNMMKAVPSSMLMYVTFRRVQYGLEAWAETHKQNSIKSADHLSFAARKEFRMCRQGENETD